MPDSSTYWVEVQLLTRASPTLESEGVGLSRCHQGFRVTLSSVGATTLSGGGTLNCWYYNSRRSEWIRNPDLDLIVPTAASGNKRNTFPDQIVAAPIGGILYAASAVTVSAGTTCEVEIELF